MQNLKSNDYLLLPSHESALVFSMAWFEGGVAPGTAPTEGHLATDAHGRPFLCLFSSALQRGMAFYYPKDGRDATVQPAFGISAVAVAAVCATRVASASCLSRPRDLLVLLPDGRLALYVGDRHLVDISLNGTLSGNICAQGHSVETKSHAMSTGDMEVSQLSDGTKQPDAVCDDIEDDQDTPQCLSADTPLLRMKSIAEALDQPLDVVALKDAVGNRVTLLTKANQSIRVSLPYQPEVPLLSQALDALKVVLSEPKWWQFYKQWLLEGPIARNQTWEVFEQVLLQLVDDKEPVLRVASSATEIPSPQPYPSIDDWEYLLDSREHFLRTSARCTWSPSTKGSSDPSALTARSENLRILEALHSIYENSKMDVINSRTLPLFAKTLHRLALACGASPYTKFYLSEMEETGSGDLRNLGVPTMRTALMQVLNGQSALSPMLIAREAECAKRGADLLHFYKVLADGYVAYLSHQNHEDKERSLFAASQILVTELCKRGWSTSDIDTLPRDVVQPIEDSLRISSKSPLTTWPQDAYILLNRYDLASNRALQTFVAPSCIAGTATIGSAILTTPLGKMSRSPTKDPSKKPAQPAGAVFRKPSGDLSRVCVDPILPPYKQRLCIPGILYQIVEEEVNEPFVEILPEPFTDSDGMESLSDPAVKLRFGRDFRLVEVRKLLRSSVPCVLKLHNTPNLTEAEGVQQQQVKLMVLGFRTMALPFGRGAVTLGTLQPLPTEQLRIPTMCLAGKLPDQNNAVVNLDLSNTLPAPGGGGFSDYTAWPEFHNGLASGLRLTAAGQQLTRTWIVYNKPNEPSYTHAGFLLALGLTGQLSCLAATDLYRYLAQEHDATIIAVLLGMGAAKRGSMDSVISKMLFLHLPSRHPHNYPELEISSLVQAASLMGVGFLFQGTAHRLMVEVMLEEMVRSPGAKKSRENNELGDGVTHDREGYALAAGFGLGLIALGKGRSAIGLADLNIEERLCRLMTGTRHISQPILESDPTLGDSEKVQLISTRDAGGNRHGGTVAEELAAAQGASQVVLEPENLVNIDAAGPAAAVALGLMYLQTNSHEAAALFELPETAFGLDRVRPEHLALKVWMRSVILWDSIKPTGQWVQAQLPKILRGELAVMVKRKQVAHAHCCALAGACLALGVRYAGSQNSAAEQLLREQLMSFLAIKSSLPEPPGHNAPLNRLHVEQCVSSCALSLAAVMAGTGHLGTMKILRGMLKRVAVPTNANCTMPTIGTPPTSSMTYGSHAATAMALGWLFLGAGGRTFGRSLKAAAALIISMYPHWMGSTMDNRYYLQPLRHLYVLASEELSLQSMNVYDSTMVHAPLRVELAGGEVIDRVAPCLLPEDAEAIQLAGQELLQQRVAHPKGMVYVQPRGNEEEEEDEYQTATTPEQSKLVDTYRALIA